MATQILFRTPEGNTLAYSYTEKSLFIITPDGKTFSLASEELIKKILQEPEKIAVPLNGSSSTSTLSTINQITSLLMKGNKNNNKKSPCPAASEKQKQKVLSSLKKKNNLLIVKDKEQTLSTLSLYGLENLTRKILKKELLKMKKELDEKYISSLSSFLTSEILWELYQSCYTQDSYPSLKKVKNTVTQMVKFYLLQKFSKSSPESKQSESKQSKPEQAKPESPESEKKTKEKTGQKSQKKKKIRNRT